MAQSVKHGSYVYCNLACQLFHTTVAFIAPSCHDNCIQTLRTLLFLNDHNCSHCRANMLLYKRYTQTYSAAHISRRREKLHWLYKPSQEHSLKLFLDAASMHASIIAQNLFSPLLLFSNFAGTLRCATPSPHPLFHHLAPLPHLMKFSLQSQRRVQSNSPQLWQASHLKPLHLTEGVN